MVLTCSSVSYAESRTTCHEYVLPAITDRISNEQSSFDASAWAFQSIFSHIDPGERHPRAITDVAWWSTSSSCVPPAPPVNIGNPVEPKRLGPVLGDVYPSNPAAYSPEYERIWRLGSFYYAQRLSRNDEYANARPFGQPV